MTEARRPRICLIAAMSRNRVIGRDGDLPWHLPEDLKRFKRLTRGHAVVMGRRTWESIGGRPLPDRRNLVLTRQAGFRVEGGEVVDSLEAAIEACHAEETLFVAGGEQVYREALGVADEIRLTVLDADVAGDTYFPEIDQESWALAEAEPGAQTADSPHLYRFELWRRDRPT